jgi:hypothetical protein
MWDVISIFLHVSGFAFLYVGLKYLMVNLKKKLLKLYKNYARNITLRFKP